ncbi:sugar phosphate isomerase/epimerase family protein [Arthrobacter bambusae]|uniref:sugar phosphate isomerase/epimerase family protein n=1 Tax=Arthrobacter bambusae TaxID=1338426 RepID=UPI002789517F|nr:sugar phosphate isomerase/epimerase family protein [Arthrobacter bambusae]MDQ0028483.1 D-psicose/D-tagatose/L-ribulose 3-epimerase [Arthrobacter bambusae]MDQ0096722.1 D-psicose/D-tagatose/L-ribulose 3-epimerase [Arthrobacter bambusae]
MTTSDISQTTLPKLAVNTFVWCSPLTPEWLDQLVPKISAWGFEAIELPLESIGDWDSEATGQLLRDYALEPVICAVMPPGRDLIACPGSVREETQDYLRSCVEAAITVGSTRVVGPMYAAVGRTWRMEAAERTAAMGELREALRPIADYAGDRGVVLGVEPLNRYETSVLNTTAQALDLIEGLPVESVGLNLDVYHMNIEEKSTPAALREAGERLMHLQVCGNDRGTPGEDHLDWEGIREALADINYSGVLGIESFTADNKTIATAASIWRPLARTQDAIAEDGIAFLRPWMAAWPSIEVASETNR